MPNNGRNAKGHFAKRNTFANSGGKRKALTKQIISPVDLMRDEFLQAQPQFFSHELKKKGITKIAAFGDSHYINDKIQNRPQKMINHKPMLNFLEDFKPELEIFSEEYIKKIKQIKQQVKNQINT